MSSKPLVSVIIPLKNRRDLVVETLASIQQQTCPRWEAVVVDDGSTDGSAERVAAAAAEDPRIRLLHRQGARPGAPVARNQGFGASTAPYVMFLDSDDLLAPTCMEGRIKALEAEPSLAFVVFVTELFRKTPGDLKRYWNSYNDENDMDRFLCGDSPWSTEGPLWRREALAQVIPWDERARRWQDWEFHLRALTLGLPYQKIPLADHYYRRTGSDTISSTRPSREDGVARAELFLRVRQILRDAGHLTPQRDRVFLGLFQYLMHPHLSQCEDVGAAALLWRMCLQNGLIDKTRYYRGLTWINLRRLPMLRWRIDRPLLAFFNELQLINMSNRNLATTITVNKEAAVSCAP